MGLRVRISASNKEIYDMLSSKPTCDIALRTNSIMPAICHLILKSEELRTELVIMLEGIRVVRVDMTGALQKYYSLRISAPSDAVVEVLRKKGFEVQEALQY